MTNLFGIGFLSPWLLLGLLALPVLWFLLRAVPPAPLKRNFPGVVLLLGLKDSESVSDKTPWWLLLLRMLVVVAIIVGLAGPILNPDEERSNSTSPVLVVIDGSWAGAANWDRTQQAALSRLARFSQRGRTAALLNLSNPETPVFVAASAVADRLSGQTPRPWSPSPETLAKAAGDIAGLDAFDTLWLSDGIDYEGRTALLVELSSKGNITVLQGGAGPMGLLPATYEGGVVNLQVIQSETSPSRSVGVLALGTDPAGNEAILARSVIDVPLGAQATDVAISLPAELRARISHFAIEGQRSAGSITLVDDALRRREIALIAGRDALESLQLLSPLHYLEQALEPNADLLKLPLGDVLPANPDVIVLADVAALTEQETAGLLEWAKAGGILVRFAGPRVAASKISRAEEDPLMPVRLRSGGRSVGGAMSWGEPKALASFAQTSPFYGLRIPRDVRVTAQVMAQPDPTLSERVIAELTDGTPLVTRKPIGDGQVILFHVTANAEWSNLPLSGLFVDMLERLSVASLVRSEDSGEFEGTTWMALSTLDGYGNLQDAGILQGVDGLELRNQSPGPTIPPGLYQFEDRIVAKNVLASDSRLVSASWPPNVTVSGLEASRELPLGGALLALALVLLVADIIASLALSGRLRSPRLGATASIVLVGLLFFAVPAGAQSTEDTFALDATAEVVLAHIITGDRNVDDVAEAGLRGLSDTLFFRTSVEPADPVGINLETDELAFFPFIYWPITPEQPRPSTEAYAKLNEYLRSGGLILFDTRDANLAGLGTSSPNGRKLQQLAAPLDIPPLEPVPHDHILTRTFYLLQDFPGRYVGRDVWVEAAPADAEAVEGMPFRNLNDGVTPVVIGGNDWASAWATTSSGAPMLPIGRGFSGERQREIAFRFGVNLVMHVLTGNYKSDQVHVPALLDRLGQ